MKKGLIFLMCLFVAMMSTGALAYERLSGAALIDEDGLYYAGSVDGTERGVFSMRPDGTDVKKIYGSEALLIAADEEYLLIQDYNAQPQSRLVLMDQSGRELYEKPCGFSSAAVEDGVFYVGNLSLTVKDGQVTEKALFDITEEQTWQIRVLCVEDGYLYLLDSTKYAPILVEGENDVSGAIVRVNLGTLERSQITPEGAALIDVDDGKIIYTLTPFWVDEGGEAKTAPVEAGLYRANADGSESVRLYEPDSADPNNATNFSLVDDGVVYGMNVRFDEAGEMNANLVRVTLGGERLPDIPSPGSKIALIDDGLAYVLAAGGDMEGDQYVQRDEIHTVDLATGAVKGLLGGEPHILFYAEVQPELVKEDGWLYFLESDAGSGQMRLMSMTREGKEMRALAKGYDWSQEVSGGEDDASGYGTDEFAP